MRSDDTRRDSESRQQESFGSGHHRRRRRHGRKERVLHTRISEQLEDDLKRVADDLRVPVSNLVRSVLEEAFSVVESVSDNVGDLIEDVVEEADRVAHRWRHMQRRRRTRARFWNEDDAPAAANAEADAPARSESAAPAADTAPPPDEPDDLLGWQQLVLHREQRCRCGRRLARGSQAFVGVTRAGMSDTIRCQDCIQALH